MLTVDYPLTEREVLLIVKSLQDSATHSMGDPLGRRDREQLAKSLLAQLPKEAYKWEPTSSSPRSAP
jgi:hypothetical protein